MMLRARLEAALAVLFAVAALVTTLWPTWIETVTGLEPDAGKGGTEWQVVVAFGVAAAVAAVLARRDFRLARTRQALVRR